MRNRDKILNNLHDLYMQRDHAEDMVELYGDKGDQTAMFCWEDARHAIQATISKQRQALTKAGTFSDAFKREHFELNEEESYA